MRLKPALYYKVLHCNKLVLLLIFRVNSCEKCGLGLQENSENRRIILKDFYKNTAYYFKGSDALKLNIYSTV